MYNLFDKNKIDINYLYTQEQLFQMKLFFKTITDLNCDYIKDIQHYYKFEKYKTGHKMIYIEKKLNEGNIDYEVVEKLYKIKDIVDKYIKLYTLLVHLIEPGVYNKTKIYFLDKHVKRKDIFISFLYKLDNPHIYEIYLNINKYYHIVKLNEIKMYIQYLINIVNKVTICYC